MKKDTKKTAKEQEVKSSFSGNTLTNYSGVSTIFKFMSKLEIAQSLNTLGTKVHHNAKYDTGKILSAIAMGLNCGLNRISKIENFTLDPLVQHLLGLTGPISDSTIKNYLKKFDMKQTTAFMEMIGKTSRKVHQKLGTCKDILDIDSSVKTVYGNQQGASKGFNEKKKGAKSYHPLLAFLGSTRECLLSWLRPGNTYTANGSSEFIKQAFDMLPKRMNSLLVRGDSGFFNEKLIRAIEERKGAQYLIKVKLKNILRILGNQEWQKVPGLTGVEICDFEYRPGSWERSRNFYAVRILKGIHGESRLFPVKDWEYFCYCTNIVDNPLQIHKLYGDRGTSENWIENIKNQMFAGQLLTSDFWANEALWLSSVLAYNISVWMRKLSDEKSWHEEPATFRAWFVQLAGKLVKSGRQVFLKMYKAYYYKERWRTIDDAVQNMSFN